jgi:hypothetical protein
MRTYTIKRRKRYCNQVRTKINRSSNIRKSNIIKWYSEGRTNLVTHNKNKKTSSRLEFNNVNNIKFYAVLNYPKTL